MTAQKSRDPDAPPEWWHGEEEATDMVLNSLGVTLTEDGTVVHR